MARANSLLASKSLENLHAPLPASRIPQVRSAPAGYLEASSTSDIPSLTRRAKSVLVNYPCRLRAEQIAALNQLKEERGVLPAELIRDAVDLVLRRIEEEGQ